jgi:predicted anti-sigma-YlaC factor YlaD
MSHTGGLDERHDTLKKLLPWHMTGMLDTEDAARFESHLAECAECQTELVSERALARQVCGLSLDVERNWAGLRQRIANDDAPDRQLTAQPIMRRPYVMRWVLGGQTAAIIILALFITVPQFHRAPQYHALGAPAVMKTGNMIVVFRPDTPEIELRRILRDSGARLVDGPTATDAYVLRVTDAGRSVALAKLRAEADVVLAEPIDAGPQP